MSEMQTVLALLAQLQKDEQILDADLTGTACFHGGARAKEERQVPPTHSPTPPRFEKCILQRLEHPAPGHASVHLCSLSHRHGPDRHSTMALFETRAKTEHGLQQTLHLRQILRTQGRACPIKLEVADELMRRQPLSVN